ncbi:MAG: heavy-metal-associated domain-containing protein [Candidatus Heimdallarchaeaceae archaeon]
MDEVILNIEGMTCGHCVMTVTKALQGVTGVKKVKVDLEKRTAKVKFDSKEATIESMINAIVDFGYKATAV